MKLIPHNKNVGLVFFGALVLVAIFLFISDKGPTPSPSLTRNDLLGHPKERGTTTSDAKGAPTSDVAIAAFAQADWQGALDRINGGTSENQEVYDPSDIQVVTTATKNEFRDYAADLKQALRRYNDSGMPSEVKVMLAAYEAGDETQLTTIDALERLHTDTLADLANVKVPSDLSVYHVRIMNAIRAMIAADEGMKTVFTNSQIATAAAKAYAADVESFYTALQNISNVIQGKGITLSSTETLHVYLGMGK